MGSRRVFKAERLEQDEEDVINADQGDGKEGTWLRGELRK